MEVFILVPINKVMTTLYTDCFVIGKNPSNTGGGYLICDDNKNIIDKETVYKAGFTNNEGELLGVLRATELIDSHGTVYTDSQNTILWIKKGYSKARPDLSLLMAKAKSNIEIKKLKLVWTARHMNMAGVIIENSPKFK